LTKIEGFYSNFEINIFHIINVLATNETSTLH